MKNIAPTRKTRLGKALQRTASIGKMVTKSLVALGSILRSIEFVIEWWPM